jgi:hypothetical protein
MFQAVEAPPRPKARNPRFAVSRGTRAFRRAFFPEADDRNWNDWRWQLRHSLRGLEALERVLQLSDEERAALQRNRNSLPNAIPQCPRAAHRSSEQGRAQKATNGNSGSTPR